MLQASYILTLLLSAGIPLVLFLIVCLKTSDGWKWLLWGAGAYIILYCVIDLAFVSFLNSQSWFADLLLSSPFLYVLILSLMETFFVIGGSWLILKVISRRKDEDVHAAEYGIGYGGLASLMLVGAPMITLMSSQSEIQESLSFVLSGLERVFMLILYIFWFICLMENIRTRKIKPFLLSTFSYLILNTALLYMLNILNVPVYYGTILLLVLAGAAGWYLYRIFKKTKTAS